jgi:O-antigen/teichoic acid export membrane protein
MLVTMGVAFMLTPFLLRQLGAEDYGLSILVGSVLAYTELLDFGLSSAITKYVAEYHARHELAQARPLLTSALRLYALIGIMVAAGGLVAATVFAQLFNVSPQQSTSAMWVMALGGLSAGLARPASITHAVLRGLQRFDLLNLGKMASVSLSTIAVVTTVLMGGGVVGMVAVGIPILLIVQVFMLGLIRRAAPELTVDWRGGAPRHVATFVSFSTSTFLINLSGLVWTKTDEILIGLFLPVASITPYSIARRIGEMPQVLADQFMANLMPLASQFNAKDEHVHLRALFLTSTRITLAIATPLACAPLMLAAPILTVWLGAAYTAAAPLVYVLTIAFLFDTSMWPAGIILQGMARHRIVAIVSLGSAAINLGISLILIRPYGVLGVALGTLIPTVVEVLGFVIPYAMHVLGVNFHQFVGDCLVPLLGPVIVMVLITQVLLTEAPSDSVAALALISAVALSGYSLTYIGLNWQQTECTFVRQMLLTAWRSRRWR